MTGWRVGYAAAPGDIIAAMTKIHQYTIMCAPTMAQVAAIEALKSGATIVVMVHPDYQYDPRLVPEMIRRSSATKPMWYSVHACWVSPHTSRECRGGSTWPIGF
jgi:aspartate/methionine/tyrosine aminotransferase